MKIHGLNVLADVMIIPNVLSEVVFAFEGSLSSILLAILAWETLSVLSMGPLMPLVCVQSGELLLTAIMLASERSMACARSVQCYLVLALARIHAFIACTSILMHSPHVVTVTTQVDVAKLAAIDDTSPADQMRFRLLWRELSRHNIGTLGYWIKVSRSSIDETT